MSFTSHRAAYVAGSSPSSGKHQTAATKTSRTNVVLGGVKSCILA
jgi:hypothetical protein